MASVFDMTADNSAGDCSISQGATYSYGLTLADASNTAINLTGCTIASQIRDTPASSTILATFTVVITNATAGTVSLTLSATQTAGLMATPDGYYYAHDVLLTRADGSIIRVLEGAVEVTAQVTR